tara:strand:+ start:103 stop:672 length:570 start_codon:yes stop_codon:yes gene_type:complete
MNTIILEEYKNKITPLIKNILNKKVTKYTFEYSFLGDDSIETKEREKIAFKERQIKMKHGDIAQIMIGNWMDMEDLGIGHKTGLDCRKLDNSMILEIKNKYNTCNSGSTKAVLDKLSKYKINNPNTECIWGIINPKKLNEESNKKIIYHNNVEIIKLQGEKLFEKIFILDGYNYTNDIRNIIRNIMYNN